MAYSKDRRLDTITDYEQYGFTKKMDAKNPYRIMGELTYILLGSRNVAVVYTIDFLAKRMYTYEWGESNVKKASNNRIRTNYYDEHGVYTKLNMHKLIMGTVEGFVIDHCDGNIWNNTRGNLRHITQAENARNRHKHEDLPKPMRYDDGFFKNSFTKKTNSK